MDYLEELDRMAGLISGQTYNEGSLSEAKIQLWQKLFSYSHDEAVAKLSERNDSLSRHSLSDDLWNEIKDEWIERGYDKDAYEHMLERQAQVSRHIGLPTMTSTASKSSQSTCLLKMEGELSTQEQIQALIGSTRDLLIKQDEEDPSMRFCFLSLTERQMIKSKLRLSPTFISLGAPPSIKKFDPCSKHPTLGIETTLPQHRANSNDQCFEPKQDQYPVWYFFYGNLAKAGILSSRLGLNEEDIEYVPAIIHSACMSTWKGKYRALLDGEPHEFVNGSGFLVIAKEVEDWLRAYETIAYEVVRCRMEFKNGTSTPACVFRFCGTERALV